MLLQRAMKEFPQLQLWVFQKNIEAIKFYERHGFLIVEATDGANNEEKEPDARYVWVRA
jgi:ribosomal protein S18 acetylase RimI-like enzyme